MAALPRQEEPSFWEKFGPGMLQLGGGYLGERMAARRGEAELRKAQGPLYDQLMGQAGRSLSLAGSMDPQVMAAQRFAQQQALLAPGMEADRQDLMRQLQKQGLLGVSSFSPVPGTVATPGVAMNPHLAALYAAQEGAKAKSAYDAQREGEAYLDSLLRRSGMLQGQAQVARSTGQMARGYLPSKPSIGETLLRGGMSLLKDPRALKSVTGMIGSGIDWLRGSTPSYTPTYTPIGGYQDWDAY